MRRLRAIAALLLLGLTLSGCTGTTQSVPPLLLAVGREDPANTSAYQIVLVEDAFPNQPRFVVLSSSAKSLPYAAVASDVVDRANTRSSLVVLTRDPSGGAAPASALVTFQFSGIDPGSPTAFTKAATLQLTGPPAQAPIFTGDQWCFTHVTVSRDGRYAFLIDDPNACASTPSVSAVTRLYQVDTATNTVEQIAASVPSPVQPTAPFDDQAATKEGLYFLVSGPTDAQIYRVPVPYDPTQSSPVWVNGDATLPGKDQTVLSSNGTDLLAITNGLPYDFGASSVSSSLERSPLPPAGAGKSVATVDGARTLAIDPSGFNPRAVVAGYSQIAVHSSPTDDKPATTPQYYGLTGVAATMDPLNNFGYVVDNGRIVLIDLLDPQSYGVSTTTSMGGIPTSEFALPQDLEGRYLTAVAWARSKLP